MRIVDYLSTDNYCPCCRQEVLSDWERVQTHELEGTMEKNNHLEIVGEMGRVSREKETMVNGRDHRQHGPNVFNLSVGTLPSTQLLY